MSNDDRLHRYLSHQAAAITLSPADPERAATRGARRRARRRGAVISSVAVLAVVAVAAAVVDRGDGESSVTSGFAAAAATPSTYDWTVVDPQSGLGYSRGSAAVVDGTVYRLSTSPGASGDASFESGHLYRSTDGAEWGEVGLPADLVPSSLAASGSTLYALGTAPAGGGGRDLVLASSRDGATTWEQIQLPDEVTELDARFPGEVFLSQPSVAVLDDDHVVAAITVQSSPNVSELVPELADGAYTFETSVEGVTVLEHEGCSDPEVSTGACSFVDEAGERSSTTIALPDPSDDEPTVHATYTWDELGVDPELQALVEGRTYLYRTQDGEHFEAATVPSELDGATAQVVATARGFTAFVADWDQDAPTTRVLTSADGAAFVEAPGSPLRGAASEAGVLAGRPAVAVFDRAGATAVHVGQEDGSWSELPLAEGGASSGDVAFGPLGFAAVIWEAPAPGSEVSVPHLVHSADGLQLSSVSLEDKVGSAAPNVLGVTVTADAVFVRIGGPVDDDPGTPPTQQVLVGTPA